MPTIIDIAIQSLPEQMRDDFARGCVSGKHSLASATVHQLNGELLHRADRIRRLEVQLKATEELLASRGKLLVAIADEHGVKHEIYGSDFAGAAILDVLESIKALEATVASLAGTLQ